MIQQKMSHADDLLLQEKWDLMAMLNPIHVTLTKASHRRAVYKQDGWISTKILFVGRGFDVDKILENVLVRVDKSHQLRSKNLECDNPFQSFFFQLALRNAHLPE